MKNLTSTKSKEVAKKVTTKAKPVVKEAKKATKAKEANLEAKQGKAIQRTILGVALSQNVASEVVLTVNVLQKAKTPLTLARIVEQIKQIKFEQGTPKDCKFSNLETRVRRSLRNSIDIASNRNSIQSKKFSIASNYSNLTVVEKDNKFSLKVNGKNLNVRKELIAKPKK